ncbi:hypothetical protein [Aridibaculum aurantiacum]|uniref:hypothetical protein n=1 Tax=Aridibaculum aurantiacum TaxID=2810307 RepID=UPI001A97857F|nr:hypothetical protein [Aridibaculum aurantiacum]
MSFIMFIACNGPTEQVDDIQFQQQLDSAASASIDSAYKVIQAECQEKIQLQLPVLIDSILKADSLSK